MAADDQAWREWRRGGIGGSDVAGILGLSNFASPWSVWADKVGLTSHQEDSRRQRIGRRMEVVIAAEFHDETGLWVAGEQTWCTHRDEPWALCTVDGFVVESSADVAPADFLGGFEAKTDGRFSWPDGVPPSYQAQSQWSMYVTGLDHWWFGVMHAGWQFRVYELERDQADIDYIVGKVRTFWETNVLTGNPPEVDGSAATATAIAEVWPAEIPGAKVDLDDLADRIEQRRKLKEAIKSATAELDVIDNEIKAAMADDEIGCIDGVPVLTYRSITVNRKPQPASTTTYRALKPATKKDLENA